MNVETSISGRRPVPWGKQDVFKHVWVFALPVYLSIRPGLLRCYMVGHSQDRTLKNKTMSIFESSDRLRSTMGTTTPKQHRTLHNLFSIQYFCSSKGHCMNIVGHFQGLCFCNFGWGVPFVILWGMLIWYNYVYIFKYLYITHVFFWIYWYMHIYMIFVHWSPLYMLNIQVIWSYVSFSL